MKLTPTKHAAAIAVGSLLFFLLGRFAVIPSPVPTVNLCVQYGFLGFWAVVFGPVAGGLAGLLGHIAIDLTAGELCWSWIIASAVFGARPGARRENIESYIKRLEKLEEIANSFNGVETSFAIQAGREIRVMVKPEAINDDQMVLVARDIVKEIENNLDYPGQIKVNLIRENRVVDYAK